MDDEREFAFLDHVVEEFGTTAKVLIAEAESSRDLSDICFGALAAACLLYCRKLGVEEGRDTVLRKVQDIFADHAENEAEGRAPHDATLH